MAPRKTRASAAAEVAAAVSPQQLSSPPATPATATPPVKTKRPTRKQAQASQPEIKDESNAETSSQLATPASTRKRTRTSKKPPPVFDELPHNLGPLPSPDTDETKEEAEDDAPPKKRARLSAKAKQVKADPDQVEKLADKAIKVASPGAETEKKPKKPKKAGYGLTPGQTPYPDWSHPTLEECQEVDRLLSEVHGKVQAPKTIPLPSLTVSGCGEVPSVLDALIRTRLSAATTGANSSRAFQGLVKAFGTIKEGVGKGSVDWNAVRLASQNEVFESIKSGGLADVKSKDIKKILEMVYQQNQARGAALKEETKTSSSSNGPSGSENEPTEEKKTEIARADSNVLSLDHLHLLSNEEAFNEMVKFPGIGPKTASCVLLFCLQRPSFAVDTHVFRMCQWLGWVPPPSEVKKGEPKVDRNTTFSHCEVRVADEFKYPLHQLLIKHGKVCPRCQANRSPSSARWGEGCPIEHLVKRTGINSGEVPDEEDEDEDGKPKPKKKSASRKSAASSKSAKGKAKKLDSESESEAESSGLSELDSEDKPKKKTAPRKKTVALRKKNVIAKKHHVDSESETGSSALSELDSDYDE